MRRKADETLELSDIRQIECRSKPPSLPVKALSPCRSKPPGAGAEIRNNVEAARAALSDLVGLPGFVCWKPVRKALLDDPEAVDVCHHTRCGTRVRDHSHFPVDVLFFLGR